ncbi:MAG: hypothetical protein ABIO48_07425 [Pedococcus sp.]
MNPCHVVAVVGLVLLTSACEQPRACTEIGATNGVSVSVDGADRTQDLVVEACVDEACSTGTLFASDTGGAFVDLAAVDSTDPVDVTVTVRTQSGQVLVPATTVRSTPRTVQPNGPGCDPSAHQAAVTVAVP